MRYAAGMARRAAARKARHRKIEAAPEEMYRAGLAEEGGAELLEHPIGIDKNLQKSPHRAGVVRGMLAVLRKPDRLRQFVGHVVDGDVNAELREISHDRCVKARNRLSRQGKLPLCAVTGRNQQVMIDQVEVDLKAARAVWYRRGRQAPAVTYSATCQEWFSQGARARRILPMIW